MTLLPPARLDARMPTDRVRQAGQASAQQLVTRLRGAAAEMVPFSGTKTLLREAASTIERLDGSARRHAVELDHLTAELAQARR
jgi:hypothetical protein